MLKASAQLAEQILAARRLGKAATVSNQSERQISLEEAYAVQSAVVDETGPVGGFKVANKSIASRIMAPIFLKDIWRSPAFLDVPACEAIGIELEVGFLIDAPLPPRDAADRRARVADCLSALPVIEIVRTRLSGDVTPELKLADNQINGGLVVGTPLKDWQSMNLGSVRARLSLGTEVVLEGEAQVPGGDAFENFLVLEEMIGSHCGGLKPDQIVITGSLNGLPYVQADLAVQGEITGLGAVSVDLRRMD